MKSRLVWSLAGAAALAAAPALAADISVRDPVMRLVAPGVANTAGYMTIANAGRAEDRLVGVSCACAAKVEAHVSHVMDGKAMMMAAGPVAVPAGGEVAFRPGGLHLMITGLKTSLKEGATQEIVLRFRRAGEVRVPFRAQSRIALAR